MVTSEYIKDRWLVKALRHICDEQSIALTSFSNDWLFELSRNNITRRILGYKFDLNSGVAAQTTEDKVASSMILAAHDVPAVPHTLVRTKNTTYDWKNPDYNQVVVKPLVGSGGIGVRLFQNQGQAGEWMNSQTTDGWAISPFVSIKREIRLIVLDGEVLLAYEKHPVMIDGLLMFNLGLGATPSKIVPSDELQSLAKEACTVLALRLAAVDIIELENGELNVMEVNDGIMMEHYALVSKEYEKDALKVYSTIVSTMMTDTAAL
ncbi:MAG: ATP-grasp domain-containing protein [Candidatus Microsaccharimonas sp.]